MDEWDTVWVCKSGLREGWGREGGIQIWYGVVLDVDGWGMVGWDRGVGVGCRGLGDGGFSVV